jgi:hypothetical protein
MVVKGEWAILRGIEELAGSAREQKAAPFRTDAEKGWLTVGLEVERQVRLEKLVREVHAGLGRGLRRLAAVCHELRLDPLPDGEVAGVIPNAVALLERWTDMSDTGRNMRKGGRTDHGAAEVAEGANVHEQLTIARPPESGRARGRVLSSQCTMDR